MGGGLICCVVAVLLAHYVVIVLVVQVFLATLFVPFVMFAVLFTVNKLVIKIAVRNYVKLANLVGGPQAICGIRSRTASRRGFRKASSFRVEKTKRERRTSKFVGAGRSDAMNEDKDRGKYVSTQNQLIWDDLAVITKVPSVVPQHLKRICDCYPQGTEHAIEAHMCMRGRLQNRLVSLRNRVVKVTLLVLFGLYVPLSRQIMRLWQCVEVGSQSFLVADLQVQCYDDTWWRYASAAFVVGALVVLGVPAVFLVLVFMEKNRRIYDYLYLLDPVLRVGKPTFAKSPSLYRVFCAARVRKCVKCERSTLAVLTMPWSQDQLEAEVLLMLERSRQHLLARGKGWKHPVGGVEKSERISYYLGATNLENPRTKSHIGFMYEVSSLHGGGPILSELTPIVSCCVAAELQATCLVF